MNPICAVYMLFTMQQSRNVANAIFNETARHIAMRITELDRISLGKLLQSFAKARVFNVGLFKVVAKESLRRCQIKEGPQSLSPAVLEDLFEAFSLAKFHDPECFEALMMRVVGLFDCDNSLPYIHSSICAPSASKSGKLEPTEAFTMQGLTMICKCFVILKKVDLEFFQDVAEFVLRCLGQGLESADRFIGEAKKSLPGLGYVFAEANVFHGKLFETLKLHAFRRKDDMKSEDLSLLWQAMVQQRREEEKRQRSQGPQRRRGAMGRALQATAPVAEKQSRRERAQLHREALQALSEEEAEALSRGFAAPVEMLMSNLRISAEEPHLAARKGKTEVMEASTAISLKGVFKAQRRQIEKGILPEKPGKK